MCNIVKQPESYHHQRLNDSHYIENTSQRGKSRGLNTRFTLNRFCAALFILRFRISGRLEVCSNIFDLKENGGVVSL